MRKWVNAGRMNALKWFSYVFSWKCTNCTSAQKKYKNRVPNKEQHVAPINTIMVEKSVIMVTVTTLIRTIAARSTLPFMILLWVPRRRSSISTGKFWVFVNREIKFDKRILVLLTDGEEHDRVREKEWETETTLDRQRHWARGQVERYDALRLQAKRHVAAHAKQNIQGRHWADWEGEDKLEFES